MKRKPKTIPTRMPKNVYNDLDNALQIRFKNNLIKRKEMKMTEALKLIGRTPEWKRAIERLKVEPRKEDLI